MKLASTDKYVVGNRGLPWFMFFAFLVKKNFRNIIFLKISMYDLYKRLASNLLVAKTFTRVLGKVRSTSENPCYGEFHLKMFLENVITWDLLSITFEQLDLNLSI